MRSNNLRRVVGATLLALFLAGCKTTPEDQTDRLNLNLPDKYDAAAKDGALPSAGWLADFGDSTLTELVAEAQTNNPNLQATAARLRASQATARIVGAGRFPTASGRAAANRAKRNASSGFRIANPVNDSFNLDASMAWELDLWGKILNRTRAAKADFQAAAADYQAARLSLGANVVRAWFNAVEAELQVQLAEKTLASFEKNLSVLEQGFDRGVNRALDVRLSRANVANARGSLQSRRSQRDSTVRALEVLLGRYPADKLMVATSLPAIDRDVPAGLPSELLRRRPDILAAERRLAAANQRYKASRKDLLPTISLSASGGLANSRLRDLIDPNSNVWSLGSNLTQPFFQGGRLLATVDQNRANEEAALASFTQTALTAFQEVETALATGGYLREQEAAIRLSSQESILADELAWSQYQRGLVDIITVLESQRRSFTSQVSLLQITNQRLQNRVTLYLALGGDFDAVPLLPEDSEAATDSAATLQ